MTRINLVEESKAPASILPFYAKGYPGPIAASLANVPEIMQLALPLVMRVLGPSHINARTKEIVILRASALQQCRYCTSTHSVIAMDSGLSTGEVQALRGEKPWRDTFKDPIELALLAWTETVATGGKPVDEALLKGLKKHFGEADVVELTMLVATTVLLNRYATALDLPVADAHLVRLSQTGLA